MKQTPLNSIQRGLFVIRFVFCSGAARDVRRPKQQISL